MISVFKQRHPKSSWDFNTSQNQLYNLDNFVIESLGAASSDFSGMFIGIKKSKGKLWSK